MPFSIVAKSNTSGASDTTVTVTTKSEAIKKAVDFLGEGYSDVRIEVGGKAYDPMELAAANIEGH